MKVCEQTCINGGVCTAPNTCTCPREWSGYNCSYPVCEQGKFLKNGNSALDTDAKDGKNLILLMKMEWIGLNSNYYIFH